jgi:hypothetical protein
MKDFRLRTLSAALAVLMGPAASIVLGHSMLYAPSEGDDPAFRAAISALIGGPVDYYDARVGTPTVAELAAYDCVHTWANFAYANNVAFGDNLAAYVDGGGRAILGVFSTYTSGNFLSGQIMTPSYSPVYAPFGTNHFSFSSYAGDGSPSLHAGVVTYGIQYRDVLALQGSGVVDAHYQDGEIAVAYRPDLGVIYVNGTGASQLGAVGDWAQLLANTCLVGAVPEPAACILALFGMAGIATIRRKR